MHVKSHIGVIMHTGNLERLQVGTIKNTWIMKTPNEKTIL